VRKLISAETFSVKSALNLFMLLANALNAFHVVMSCADLEQFKRLTKLSFEWLMQAEYQLSIEESLTVHPKAESPDKSEGSAYQTIKYSPSNHVQVGKIFFALYPSTFLIRYHVLCKSFSVHNYFIR
jgi:hypothetical protein